MCKWGLGMGQILLSFQSTTYQVVVAYLIAQSCPALVNSWTVARQAPLSLGFSRQEYWSGLPFPLVGDLPHPGIEPGSPVLQADSLPSEPPSCCGVSSFSKGPGKSKL